MLAQAILVRGAVAVVEPDFAVSEAELDTIGDAVSQNAAKLGLVQTVRLIAKARDLLQRQSYAVGDGYVGVDLQP